MDLPEYTENENEEEKKEKNRHEFVQICWLIVIKHHDVVSVATVLKKQYHHDKSFKT